MDQPSRPYKPEAEERDNYFFGLSGYPKLIARTSSHQWSFPKHEEGWGGYRHSRKRYATIGEHGILSRWNKELSLEVSAVLKECSWNYFFPIRIGLENIQDTLTYPVVLLIAVEKDSLQWEYGISIALQCRQLLQHHGILNVEVEIREGSHMQYAASRELELHVNEPEWLTHMNINVALLPALSYLGYSVGYLDDVSSQGTVGLHLKLGDDDAAVYALTCRHVVCNDRSPHESYKFSEGEMRQYHVQPSDACLTKCLDQIQVLRDGTESKINRVKQKQIRWDEWYSTDETKRHLRPTEDDLMDLQVAQNNLIYCDRTIDRIKAIHDKKDRKIGYLAFHSDFQVSSQRKGYLTDWGLIKLDPEKFPRGFRNRVFGQEIQGAATVFFELGFRSLHFDRETQKDSPRVAKETQKGPPRVAKVGSTTGLTIGLKGEIEAVLRRPTTQGEDIITWERFIISESSKDNFSAPGDSGASVFDFDGNVVGLVTGSDSIHPHSADNKRKMKKHPGGNVSTEEAGEAYDNPLMWENETDITFVSPIEWVFEDIERLTGLAPRLV